MLNDRPVPWERQPGESARAFYAFTLYRDLPPRERSLRRVADLLYGGRDGATRGPHKHVPGRIKRWATRFAWAERAAAWDQEMERHARQVAIAAVEEMRNRHAQEAVALQQRAIRRLREMRPDELSPRDVLVFIIEGAKLERLSRGEPDTVTEARNPWIQAVLTVWERRRRTEACDAQCEER